MADSDWELVVVEPRFDGGSHSWHLHHLWIYETSSSEQVAVSVFTWSL
jgi:hypothetical protein